MRQIKFRAWHEGRKSMVYLDNAKAAGDIYIAANIMQLMANSVADKKSTIMQFTGLADKNGAEIYEGDVVDVCGHRIAKLEGVGFVYWCEFSAAFRVKSGAARLPHPMDPKILTVIGNIHQQPELLEQPS